MFYLFYYAGHALVCGGRLAFFHPNVGEAQMLEVIEVGLLKAVFHAIHTAAVYGQYF